MCNFKPPSAYLGHVHKKFETSLNSGYEFVRTISYEISITGE
jgi:hypothetical protein